MTDAIDTTKAAPKALATITAGAAPAAIVPRTFDEAYRIAQVVALGGMVPKQMFHDGRPSVEKIMVAIMHGAEVGLTPMMAIQSIAVVNGMPSVYGDGALAIVRASGLLEWIKEVPITDAAGKAMAFECTVKRRGEPDAVTRSFSMEDAAKAGLLSKDGPWKLYTTRMLQMRARAFALRDVFADVLKGLRVYEEVIDIPAAEAGDKPVTVVATRPATRQLDALVAPQATTVVPQDVPPVTVPHETEAGANPTDLSDIESDLPFDSDEDTGAEVEPLDVPDDVDKAFSAGDRMPLWNWMNTALIGAPVAVRRATFEAIRSKVDVLAAVGPRQRKLVEEWSVKAGVDYATA